MKKSSILSAVIYFGIAVIAGGIFYSGTLAGNYTFIERIGGAVWVFLLSTIILMPIIIPFVKKRFTE